MGTPSKTVTVRLAWVMFTLWGLWLCAPPRVQADELVLLSPHWEGIKTEFEQGFKRVYTAATGRDVRVTWMDVGGTSEILRFIRSEFASKPAGIGIDLLFGGGLEPFLVLKRAGLLQPYPEATWYGATLAGFGIIYNTIVLDLLNLPRVTTWEDLAQPVAYSWVGSADPRKSGSVHMMYEIILQAYGWDKGWEIITGMGANVRQFTSSSGQTPKDTALGEVAYGLSIDFQAWAQIQEVGSGQLQFVMPPNLTVINPDGLAMLKGAPHAAVAEAFMRFVLSAAGQKLWILKQGLPEGPQQFQLNRFSILPGLYTEIAPDALAVQVNPFAWQADFAFDSKLAASRWAVVNDLIGTLVIDQKKALNRAWQAALVDGLDDEERRRLAAMPISQAEALQLAQEAWRDPTVRNAKRNAWTQFARRKYRAEQLQPLLRPEWLTLAACGALIGAMLGYLWRYPRSPSAAHRR
jgi:ABC-type Fe3+ transport system substrate-binding protein